MSTPTAPSAWKRWDEVRESLDTDPEQVARITHDLTTQIAVAKLAELRKQQHFTQAEIARELGISQKRVSEIESAHLARTEVSTIDRYITALGGQVRIVADFPGYSITLQ